MIVSLARAGIASLMLAGLVAANAAPSFADPASWVGTWSTPTPSQDIVQIEISGTAGSLKIHAFGSCHPTLCDLGEVSLTTFG